MTLEDSVLLELRTVRKQIESLLEKYPETRNSDTLLEWYWMRYFKGINLPWVEYSKLQDFSLETVRRNRAKIQSEGLFRPTDESVIKKRKMKQTVYQKHFSEEFNPPVPEEF